MSQVHPGRMVKVFGVSFGAALCCLLATRPVAADGLIFKLPADGTSAIYNMEMDGGNRPFTGTLTVSSVGKTGSGKTARRWIEFKMVMMLGDRERTVRAKLLIPETNLGRGQAGFASAVRCYQKMQDGAVKEIDLKNPRNVGPLPAFLAGPLAEQKALKAAEVASSLGKLQCDGVAGKMLLKDGRAKVQIDAETRLHDKAPFGVVKSTMRFEVTVNGERREGGTLTLTLAKVGMNAKSELPDSN